MTDRDLKMALFTAALAAIAGVGLILYQHSLHTGQVLGALGTAGKVAGAPLPPAATVTTLSPASAAGTPSEGQENLTPLPPSPSPLTIGQGWQVSGGMGTDTGPAPAQPTQVSWPN